MFTSTGCARILLQVLLLAVYTGTTDTRSNTDVGATDRSRTGMLVNFAESGEAGAVVRGLRSASLRVDNGRRIVGGTPATGTYMWTVKIRYHVTRSFS